MAMEDKEFQNSVTQLEKASDGSPSHPGTTHEHDEDFEFTFGHALAFLAFQLGYFSDVAVGSAASAVLTVINADLGENDNYVWMVTANYVAGSCISPFIGRIGDVFGRRWVLLIGNILGFLGNLLSAKATSVNMVIGGAVIIGIGSGMHQIAWACVGEVVPKKHRPLAIGCLEVSISPAAAFGALVAYSLTYHTAGSWRNIYWINVALNGAAFFLVLFFYHPINQRITEEGTTKWGQVKSMDFIGFSLFTSGLVLFLLGLSFGGAKFPWKSAGTLAPLCVGIVLLAICAAWENYTHNPYAIFPHAVMRRWRGFTIVIGVTFLVGMSYYSTLILWPLQIQTLYSQDPTTIGLYGVALGLGGVLGGPTTGWLMDHFNHARLFLIFFCLSLTALCGAAATVGPGSHIGSTVVVVLTGTFLSAGTVASNSMIQLGIPHQYIGIAMGITITARNVGGSVATTIYTVILNNELTTHLAPGIATALTTAGLAPTSVETVTAGLLTGNTTDLIGVSPVILGAGVEALKQGYSYAFKVVYLVSITFGVLGCVCAIFTRNVGEFQTGKIDVKLEDGAHIMAVHDGGKGHVIGHDGVEIAEDM